MSEKSNIIFYSRNNFALGERMREYLKLLNKNVIYCNNLQQVINMIENEKYLIIFIDKMYRVYAKMLSIIIKSEFANLDGVRLVFIDDDLSYYVDYVDNNKMFCIPTTNLKIAIQNIVYTCQMLNYRKETINSLLNGVNESISKYLIKLGFSYKLVGFRYIKQSVELAIKNNYSLGSLQKDVYPILAQQNNTNPSNIERCIRMAIKNASQTPAFKNELNILNGSDMTNRSFLEFLIDIFRMEQNVG